ncbi:MAG: biotin/lipoyl-containing protein [Vicinamibacterales bacterium]
MPTEVVILRDASGRAHPARVSAEGQVTIGGVTLNVHVAVDGSLHVHGPRNASAWATVAGETIWVFLNGDVFTFDVEAPAGRRRSGGTHHGSLTAPMPATVRKVTVAPGDTVHRGDLLLVLEAMKMELPIRANADGTITAVNCREGEMVQAGNALIEIT